MNSNGCHITHPLHLVSEPAADPQLTAAGWQRRFTADPARAREAIQLYNELGFDVHLHTIQPEELDPACGDCRLMTCAVYQTVYTRRRAATGSQ